MSKDDERARLSALDARIRQARGKATPRPHQEEAYSQAQLAWRMVIELVAGLLIGFGIGYGLDALFGTMPLFLVLFVLLGFAAGVRVMLRTAQEVSLKDTPSGAAPDGQADDAGQGHRNNGG